MSQGVAEQNRLETARPAASKKRSRGRSGKLRVATAQLAIVVGVLAAWEFASGRIIDSLFISKPSEVFPVLWNWVESGELVYHAASTFKDAFLGLLFGGLAGLIVGCVLGQFKRLARIVEPFITTLYTMPKHALIPLFIIWVGIGSELRILTAVSIVFFLIFYNTFFGIRDVSTDLINSVRVMGGSVLDGMIRVMLPSALVWVVAAMKLAVPQAIVGVVVAEMLAGDRGLGYLVALNAGMFNSAGTFAAIIVLLIAGFLVDRLVGLVTRPALVWKESN